MGRKNKRKEGGKERRKKVKREKINERQKSLLSQKNICLNTINGMFPHKMSTVNTVHGLPMGFLKSSLPIFCEARC
jgi:hypothetical protein